MNMLDCIDPKFKPLDPLASILNDHPLCQETPMLVTFTTQAYADITMFGDVALAMLKMMGHGPTVPGAILAADVPAALSRLTAAIATEKVSVPADERDADEPVVSLAHRALPLMKLLAAAAATESNVMWK